MGEENDHYKRVARDGRGMFASLFQPINVAPPKKDMPSFTLDRVFSISMPVSFEMMLTRRFVRFILSLDKLSLRNFIPDCFILSLTWYATLPTTQGKDRNNDRTIRLPLNLFRATESELIQLFQWAVAGHERTINQRVRPGLIIVVNKDVPSADKEWLDVNYATKTLLSHLELSPRFAELREVWKTRGKVLKTAEDLIHCYYDSFRIICIPSLEPSTAQTIAVQYRKLYDEIRKSSDKLRKKKIQVGMNLDVGSFTKYMENAFSRLAKDLTSSIDFHYMASKDTDRPSKFREHVTNLLKKLKDDGLMSKEMEHGENDIIPEAELLNRITPFIACCIASKIYPGAQAEGMVSSISRHRHFLAHLSTHSARIDYREIPARVSVGTREVSGYFVALRSH